MRCPFHVRELAAKEQFVSSNEHLDQSGLAVCFSRVVSWVLATTVACGATVQVARAQSTTVPHVGPVITLDAAVAMALRQPSAFEQAEVEARIAEEDVRQAKDAFLPTFTLPLTYTFTSPLHGPELRGVPFTQRPPAFVSHDGINVYTLVSAAVGEIDLSGRLRASLDRSRASVAQAQATALVARRGLVSAVTESYYALSLARARRAYAEDIATSSEEFVAITRVLFDAGEVAEADLVKARAEASAQTDEKWQARAAEHEAAEILNAMTGLAFGEVPNVDDITRRTPDPADVAGLTVDRIAQRPEFSAADATIRAADADVRVARANRRPTLGYTVAAGIDDTTIAPHRDLGASAAVTLTVPLFDWGAAKSRQHQAELRREAAARDRVRTEQQLRSEFWIAHAKTDSAIERVRVSETGVEDARRSLELATLRYRAGEAPSLEVIDARRVYAERRGAFVQAMFDYRISIDHLRRASGQ